MRRGVWEDGVVDEDWLVLDRCVRYATVRGYQVAIDVNVGEWVELEKDCFPMRHGVAAGIR
ncbi:hypothetical protein A0H81_10509 [Grifola frondosa]|uniref:Uncharacterized protein n=1 Tax=Grifola frondosa TaxID=5627 RepID=A0A1C7LZA8_GRIFR|nr:hypothetical protein A0H81_10509 [Grifola frondosa]